MAYQYPLHQQGTIDFVYREQLRRLEDALRDYRRISQSSLRWHVVQTMASILGYGGKYVSADSEVS